MFLSVQWKYDIVKVKVSINNFRGKKRKAEGGKGAGGKKKKEETEEEKKLKVVFFLFFFLANQPNIFWVEITLEWCGHWLIVSCISELISSHFVSKVIMKFF